MSRPHADEALRAAFLARFDTVEDGRPCPPADSLWSSARGELPEEMDDQVLAHLGQCGVCAATWRGGRDLVADELAVRASGKPRRIRTAGWPAVAATAAALLVGAALWLPGRIEKPPDEPVFRAWEGDWLRPAAEGATVTRERCVLRWTPGPEGTTYDVRVTTEGLRLLAVGRGLPRPRFEVSAEALEGLSRGEPVVWQVTARLPGGRTVDSVSFVTPLE